MKRFAIIICLVVVSASANAQSFTQRLKNLAELVSQDHVATKVESNETPSFGQANDVSGKTGSQNQTYQFTISGSCICMETGIVAPGAPSQALVNFYEDHITVNGVKCTYYGSDNESKIYLAQNSPLQNLKTYYHVSKNNEKNLFKMVIKGTNTMMGFNGIPNVITTTNVYGIVAGNVPNYNPFNGATPNNIGISAPSNSFDTSSANSYNNSSSTPSQRKCTYCNGQGRMSVDNSSLSTLGVAANEVRIKCNECGLTFRKGTHWHSDCTHCRGTGYAK